MLKNDWFNPDHPMQSLADYIYRNPDSLPAIALDSLTKIAEEIEDKFNDELEEKLDEIENKIDEAIDVMKEAIFDLESIKVGIR